MKIAFLDTFRTNNENVKKTTSDHHPLENNEAQELIVELKTASILLERAAYELAGTSNKVNISAMIITSAKLDRLGDRLKKHARNVSSST